MSLFRDDQMVSIGGSKVRVTGKTGAIHATWSLLIDEREVDSAKAAGDFILSGELDDGSRIEAAVHQSLVGPTAVVVSHEGSEVARFSGFVA